MDSDFLKIHTKSLSQNYAKKYQVTLSGLRIFSGLRPRAQELFLDMLSRVGSGLSDGSLLVVGTYADFGFNSYQQFSRYRKELLDRSLIEHGNGGYCLNPNFIIYYSKQQRNHFYKIFGITKDFPLNFGVKKK